MCCSKLAFSNLLWLPLSYPQTTEGFWFYQDICIPHEYERFPALPVNSLKYVFSREILDLLTVKWIVFAVIDFETYGPNF